jgi:rhomboid protease GluP
MNENPVPPFSPEPGPTSTAVRVSLPVGVPTVTYTILGLTVAVYILQFLSVAILGKSPQGIDWLELYGARINILIRAGQVWRFFTPVLLHASVPHILFNMYALFSFGPTLERNFGHGRFFLLYILSAFTGNVFSFFLMGDNGYSVGASTAIFGLVGAEGLFLYQNRRMFGDQVRRAINNIVFVVVINLFIGLVPGIDLWGHIGGLLGGLIFTWFAGPLWEVQGIYPTFQLVDQREGRDLIIGLAAAVIPFGLLALWGMVAPVVR